MLANEPPRNPRTPSKAARKRAEERARRRVRRDLRVARLPRAGALRQVMYSLGFLVGFGVGPYVQPAWQLAALALALGAAWAVRAREENGLRFEEISIETLRPR